MSAGNLPATSRLKTLFALIGVLALIVGLGAATAQAGGGTATAAKKCKKKRSAVSAKKKCKKKQTAAATSPAPPGIVIKPKPPPPPPPPETIRAVLGWNTAADLDLYVWDSTGHLSNVDVDGIPSTEFSEDVHDGTTGDTEGIFDNLLPSSRAFTYGICDSAQNGAGLTDFDLEVVWADGTPHTLHAADFSFTGFMGTGGWAYMTDPAGSFDPGVGAPSGWCNP